jgi:hypothetical protein
MILAALYSHRVEDNDRSHLLLLIALFASVNLFIEELMKTLVARFVRVFWLPILSVASFACLEVLVKLDRRASFPEGLTHIDVVSSLTASALMHMFTFSIAFWLMMEKKKSAFVAFVVGCVIHMIHNNVGLILMYYVGASLPIALSIIYAFLSFRLLRRAEGSALQRRPAASPG